MQAYDEDEEYDEYEDEEDEDEEERIFIIIKNLLNF